MKSAVEMKAEVLAAAERIETMVSGLDRLNVAGSDVLIREILDEAFPNLAVKIEHEDAQWIVKNDGIRIYSSHHFHNMRNCVRNLTLQPFERAQKGIVEACIIFMEQACMGVADTDAATAEEAILGKRKRSKVSQRAGFIFMQAWQVRQGRHHLANAA